MKRASLPLFCISLFLSACTAAAPQPEQNVKACDADNACAVEEQAVTDHFIPMTFDESITLFENKGSGVLYYGFENCPWCAEAVPLLEETAKEQGVEIYYIKTRDENKDRLYTDEQKEKIVPYIGQYMSDNDEGELTLFVPCVVVVEDGKAVNGHVGTVDGHDAHERKMTSEEKEQLKTKYEAMLARTASY